MGSINFAALDKVSISERTERRMLEAQQRCVVEIKSRSIQLLSLIHEVESELIKQLESRCCKIKEDITSFSLEDGDGKDNFEELHELASIKFTIPEDNKDDLISMLGCIRHGDLYPSDLTLELTTKLRDIKTGAKLIFSVLAKKPVSKRMFNNMLTIAINHMDSNTTIKEQTKITSQEELKFRFPVNLKGNYNVSVKLFNSNISNSPMLIPVVDNPEELFAEAGISCSGDNKGSSIYETPGRSRPEIDNSSQNSSVTIIEQKNVSLGATPKVKNTQSPNVANYVGKSEELEQLIERKVKILPDDKLQVERSPNNSVYLVDEMQNLKINVTINQEVDDDLIEAYHEETETWKPARISKRVPQANLWLVKYEDLDIFGCVNEDKIRPMTRIKEVKDLENVVNDVKKEPVDDRKHRWIIGRWSEDDVWYNIKIMEEVSPDFFRVCFVDYGNEDLLGVQDLVDHVDHIPDGSKVDEHVQQEGKIASNRSSIISNEFGQPLSTSSVILDESPLNDLVAPSSTTQENGGVTVSDQPLPTIKNIPPSLQCTLCKELCSRGMRLSCNQSSVCWGCGVKKITSSHKCWGCDSKLITTNHLVKDEQLRNDVKLFKETGSFFPTAGLSDEKGPEESKSLPVSDMEILDFASMMTDDGFGVEVLDCKKNLSINGLSNPSGVTKLEDDTILVCCNNSVFRFSYEGKFLEKLKIANKREFHSPTDLILCQSGEIVITDKNGLHLFDEKLAYKKSLAVGECHGVAEDEQGRLITIKNVAEDEVTSVLVLNKETEQVERNFDLSGVIAVAKDDLRESEELISQCRHIYYKMCALYITDFGLDCVFMIPYDDKSEHEASMIGGRGKEPLKFRDPSGLWVDDVGNVLVVDSRNHRLQVSDMNDFIGFVKTEPALARPSNVYIDKKKRDLYVTNKLSKTLIRFSF